jgi:hypothetical protein
MRDLNVLLSSPLTLSKEAPMENQGQRGGESGTGKQGGGGGGRSNNRKSTGGSKNGRSGKQSQGSNRKGN